MKLKPVLLRRAARQDLERAVDWYAREATVRVADGFVSAARRAFLQIVRHPGAGSTRYAFELQLPGLRSWPLRKYPYVVFYVDGADHIEVWRVLHAKRDIPAGLREPGAP
jgi:toxin ParE1/3/4